MNRPLLIECVQVGHAADQPHLVFAIADADGTLYEFAITADCFMQLFALGWHEARHLGEAPTHGRSPSLETDAAAAVVNMQPGIVLMSGPLTLSIPLPDDVLVALQSEAANLHRNGGPA